VAEDNKTATGADPGWWSALDAEHQTLVQSKGWDKLDGQAAAAAIAKAYRGSEQMRGGLAAGNVVELPLPGADGTVDPVKAKAFWEKVGTPKDATGYTFEGLAHKDGSALDARYLDAARAAAAAANMPAHMARSFVEQMMGYQDDVALASAAKNSADIEANRRQLAHEWGADAARNKFIAGRAMDVLKDYLPLEAVSALESLPGVGYVGINKLFAHLGELMGEARFVSGASSGTMDKSQAQARLDTLMADTAWGARLSSGGAKELEEKSNLIRIIIGAQ
jgi:hypothetical protein